MKNCILSFFLLLLWGRDATSVLSATKSNTASFAWTEQQSSQWHFLFEEAEMAKAHHQLSQEHKPQSFAIVHASLITMVDEQVHINQTIVVEDGRIVSMGSSNSISVPQGLRVIDAQGQYLIPGLTDSHVHLLTSSSVYLLNLALGVTTVRDMDGFPWMLKVRENVQNNLLLGPNMYVSGTIISMYPMDWYMEVVEDAAGARNVVGEQSKTGYDFIKVHNVIEEDVLRAIFDEAGKQGLDVVGHVPHDISLELGLNLGYRTMEHFKSYIIDRTLSLTDEDYVALTKGREVWNTPTMSIWGEHQRGDTAFDFLENNEGMAYVSPRDKREWLALAAQPVDGLTELRQNALNIEKEIFRNLMTIEAKFLAGTDSGSGAAFLIPGFVLHNELGIMADIGLSPFKTLETATIEPARAMRRESEFGSLEVGKRADMVLLSKNPLADVNNLRAIKTVFVRGIVLDRGSLDEILNHVETVYQDSAEYLDGFMPTRDNIGELIGDLEALHEDGFVIPGFYVAYMLQLLEAAEYQEEIDRVQRSNE